MSWVATPTMQSLLLGITCPSDSPTVEWPNLGVTTYAPWFSEMVCVKFGCFGYELTRTPCQDLEAIRCISNVPRAQDQMYDKHRPMVVELAYDGNGIHHLNTITSKIEDALSKGCAVLVRGWEPTPALDFSIEAIRMFRPSVSQHVDVQSTWP